MGNDPSKSRAASVSGTRSRSGSVSASGSARAAAAAAPQPASTEAADDTHTNDTTHDDDTHGTTEGSTPVTHPEDRRVNVSYSALDDGPVTLVRRDPDPPSTRDPDRSSSEVVTIVHRPQTAGEDTTFVHPDVEALLSLSQFYPTDNSLPRPAGLPADARDITPTILTPQTVINVASSLQHRWNGVGVHALRAQIMIGKDMDRLEEKMQTALPAVHARNADLRQLNAQLQQLPDLHAALLHQQTALAKCIQAMEDLNSLLPPQHRLEDLTQMLQWQEAKEEDVEQLS